MSYSGIILFVFIDLLLFNFSITKQKEDGYCWFPKFYIYGNFLYSDDVNELSQFANRLKSIYQIKKLAGLFGTDNVTELKTILLPIEDLKKNGRKEYRYREAYGSAPLIFDYIKMSDIGTLV